LKRKKVSAASTAKAVAGASAWKSSHLPPSKADILRARQAQEADDAALAAGLRKEFSPLERAKSHGLRKRMKALGAEAALYNQRTGRLKPEVKALRARLGSAAFDLFVEKKAHPQSVLRVAKAFHLSGLDTARAATAARKRLIKDASRLGLKPHKNESRDHFETRLISQYTGRRRSKGVQFQALYGRGRGGWHIMKDYNGKTLRKVRSADRRRIESRQRYEDSLTSIMTAANVSRRDAASLFKAEMDATRRDWERFKNSKAYKKMSPKDRRKHSNSWARWRQFAIVKLKQALNIEGYI
jgi:hypothetical protein